MIFHSARPSLQMGWFRLWCGGPGISWTKEVPLFSERVGHSKPFLTVNGWRFKWLRRSA
jgi:hypothetical protein